MVVVFEQEPLEHEEFFGQHVVHRTASSHETGGSAYAKRQAAVHAKCAEMAKLPTRWGALVGVRGFEPRTSTSRTWRATKLRYTPKTPDCVASSATCLPQYIRADRPVSMRNRQSEPMSNLWFKVP